MTIHDIERICRKHPKVTEDIKWGDNLCFSVGGKMFLITTPDSVPCAASIKVADEAFEEISAKEGFRPAPYLGRYKWVWMDDINRLSYKEWNTYIETAYRIVSSKLPLRFKKQIGI